LKHSAEAAGIPSPMRLDRGWWGRPTMMIPENFSPLGTEFDEEAVEAHFAELYAWAAKEFPESLRHSPLVGYALQRALDRLRAGRDQTSRFGARLREEAAVELAGLHQAVVPMVRKLIKQNPGLARVADDVPGELYVSLHRTRVAFDPSRGSFYGWLHGVAYRV